MTGRCKGNLENFAHQVSPLLFGQPAQPGNAEHNMKAGTPCLSWNWGPACNTQGQGYRYRCFQTGRNCVKLLPGLCPKENELTSHGKIRSWSLAYQKCSGRSVEDPGWLAQAIGRKAFPRRFRGVLIAPEFAVPSFTHSCVVRKCNLHKAYKGKRRRVKHSLTILAASPRHSPFTQAVSCMGKVELETAHERPALLQLLTARLEFHEFRRFHVSVSSRNEDKHDTTFAESRTACGCSERPPRHHLRGMFCESRTKA